MNENERPAGESERRPTSEETGPAERGSAGSSGGKASSTSGKERSTSAVVVASSLGGAVAAAVIVVLIFVVVIGVGGGPAEGQGGGPGAGEGGGGMPPALVELGEAREESVRRRAEVSGRLEAVHRAVVASEVEGKVLSVGVEVGQAVVGGETELATIDDVWAKLAVERAEAAVESAEASLRSSELDLERLERLAESQAARPREVDETRAQVAADRSAVSGAKATLAQERESLQRARVLAPFDGWVTAKHVEQGEWVEPGANVVSLVSRGQVDARLDVPESLVNAVGQGETVVVLIDALGLEAEGEVVSVTPDGSGAARTFPVEVRLSDREGSFKPGMSVTGRLSVGEGEPRLTVPRDAVQFGSAGATVWVSGPMEGGGPFAGQAVPVSVEVEVGVGERFVVRPVGLRDETPLRAGVSVVTAGAERLMPGQPLTTGGPPARGGAGVEDDMAAGGE